MSARPYYKRYASDFVAGVAGLQAEQIGVYAVLLDLMYARRRKLETRAAKDVQGLARACGCNTRQFNRILGELVAIPNKITRDGEGRLSNPRFDRYVKEDILGDKKEAETYPQENESGGKNGDFTAKKHPEKHAVKQVETYPQFELDQALNPPKQPPISRAHATHYQKEDTNLTVLRGGVLAKTGNGHTNRTAMSSDQKIARFQKTIADSFPENGWLIVTAASDRTAPSHAKCLALCKAQAIKLGKGWPRQWPTAPPAKH